MERIFYVIRFFCELIVSENFTIGKEDDMKKNRILNFIMGIAMVVILAAGVLVVGSIKGWFGQEDTITVRNKVGNVTIQRAGVAYSLENKNALRDGDIIEVLQGSGIELLFGNSVVYLDENTQVQISLKEDGRPHFSLNTGGCLVDGQDVFSLEVMEKKVKVEEKTIFSATAYYGSGNVYVFGGNLRLAEEEETAGTALSILEDGIHKNELVLTALKDFELCKLKELEKTLDLCFTKEELTTLQEERASALADSTQVENVFGEPGEDKLSCTLTIRCDTILNNMENLTDGKDLYVPQDGCILQNSIVYFEEGETAFDVLKRACDRAGIQLEYSWTPIYNSYYVEGIHHLYEFDCGELSGWMFKVNEWFPNYGSSSYQLKDGDVMVWCYTCEGLGEDVGGTVY